jgi:hypothetical protein
MTAPHVALALTNAPWKLSLKVTFIKSTLMFAPIAVHAPMSAL